MLPITNITDVIISTESQAQYLNNQTFWINGSTNAIDDIVFEK